MPAGATTMAAKPVAGAELEAARHVGRDDEGVARLDGQSLVAELDGGAAVQHGPHLLGVYGVRRPRLAGAHVDAPDDLAGTALGRGGERGHDGVGRLGPAAFGMADDRHRAIPKVDNLVV